MHILYITLDKISPRDCVPLRQYARGCTTRTCQIIHTRLRLGCSNLNVDKLNWFLTTIPSCSCGHYFEDALHYFLTCSEYTELRSEMYLYSKGFDLKTILYGCSGVSASVNREILQSVHSFISRSRRLPIWTNFKTIFCFPFLKFWRFIKMKFVTHLQISTHDVSPITSAPILYLYIYVFMYLYDLMYVYFVMYGAALK